MRHGGGGREPLQSGRGSALRNAELGVNLRDSPEHSAASRALTGVKPPVRPFPLAHRAQCCGQTLMPTLYSPVVAPWCLPRGPATRGVRRRTHALGRRHGVRMRSAQPAGSEDSPAPPAAILRRPASPLCDLRPAGTDPGTAPPWPLPPVAAGPAAASGTAARRGGSEPRHGPNGAPGRWGHLTPDATGVRCCQCRSRPCSGSPCHQLRVQLRASLYPAATYRARRELQQDPCAQDRATPRTDRPFQPQTDAPQRWRSGTHTGRSDKHADSQHPFAAGCLAPQPSDRWTPPWAGRHTRILLCPGQDRWTPLCPGQTRPCAPVGGALEQAPPHRPFHSGRCLPLTVSLHSGSFAWGTPGPSARYRGVPLSPGRLLPYHHWTRSGFL